MDDDRIWAFEESLWKGDASRYRELVDEECVMVLPEPPYVLSGRNAIETVSHTPRWTEVTFSEQQVMRPQEGLITIAYKAVATREGASGYSAYCTTTMRRIEHEVWRVVQHQQTPPLIVSAG